MSDLPVLKIKTNTVRLLINEGPDVLEFDPDDILFIEGFYLMIAEFQRKQVEYQGMLEKLEKDPASDTTPQALAAMKEVCQFAHAQIDVIFGPGTSHKLFGRTLAFSPIEQFFTGITPYIQEKRAKHLESFMPPKARKPRRRKK